jgi:hypothetical protein
MEEVEGWMRDLPLRFALWQTRKGLESRGRFVERDCGPSSPKSLEKYTNCETNPPVNL